MLINRFRRYGGWGYGEVMRDLREYEGLTLRELAELVGCSESYMGLLEQGKRVPVRGIGIGLGVGLGMNVVELEEYEIKRLLERGSFDVDFGDGVVCEDFVRCLSRLSVLLCKLDASGVRGLSDHLGVLLHDISMSEVGIE